MYCISMLRFYDEVICYLLVEQFQHFFLKITRCHLRGKLTLHFNNYIFRQDI